MICVLLEPCDSAPRGCADAPIHHVRRGDHVRPGVGADQRLFDEDFERCIVRNLASVGEQAVVAVAV